MPCTYPIALATAANVGSVATLTGNPQNMLVGSFSGIGYRTFLMREAPVAVVGLALVFLVIWLVYRRAAPDAAGGEFAGALHSALPADDQDHDRGRRHAGRRRSADRTISSTTAGMVRPLQVGAC